MQIKIATLVLTLVMSTLGCAPQPVRSDNFPVEKDQVAGRYEESDAVNGAEPPPFTLEAVLECLRLGQSELDVERVLGKPDEVTGVGDYWHYNDLDLTIGFMSGSEGKLVVWIEQRRGSIAEGLRIGDSEDKVAALGVRISEHGELVGRQAVLKREDHTVVLIEIQDGAVSRLIWTYPGGP